MFFRPTIVNLKNDYYLHLLCLSNGGSKERENELKSACENLGSHKWECLDEDKFKDGLKENWKEEDIRQSVLHYIN